MCSGNHEKHSGKSVSKTQEWEVNICFHKDVKSERSSGQHSFQPRSDAWRCWGCWSQRHLDHPRAAQTHPITPCHGQSGSRHTETASAHLLCCLLRNTLHPEVPARSWDLIKIYLFKARKVNFLFPVCFIISYIAFSLSYSSVKTHAVGRLRSLFYDVISRGCPAFLLFQHVAICWLSHRLSIFPKASD